MDTWIYLGIPFTWAGREKIVSSEILEKDIENLTRGPFKPQQRLFALQTYVMPKLYHQLALGNVMLATLKSADKRVRRTIRKWLKLPHDVPNAYIHAKIQDGGLQIPATRWMAPLLRKKRLNSLQNKISPATHKFLQKEIDLYNRRLLENGSIFNSHEDLNKWWADKLHNSVDGGGKTSLTYVVFA